VRKVIQKNKVFYAIVIVVAALSVFAASNLITPMYRSISVVNPTGSQSVSDGIGAIASQLGPLTSILGADMFTSEDEKVTIAILQSRLFGEDFISKFSLMNQLSGYSDEEIEAMSQAELARVKWKAFKKFDQKLRSVSSDVRTGLIHITLDWVDPQEGARLNIAMIDELNLYLRNVAISESEQSLKYLSSQLETTTNTELKSALLSLIDDEMSRAMMANVRKDYALKFIDPAVSPIRKHSPKRSGFLLLGLVLGAFVVLCHMTYQLVTRKA
jgi:hypothetical protein